ncbi:hypothetical protein LOZ41_001064, partial [Ophidiomyces ophidiicola]
MAPALRTLLSLWLLSSSAAATVVNTCPPEKQLLKNPSFEERYTGWSFGSGGGSIISDGTSSIPDGSWFYRSRVNYPLVSQGLSQIVTGVDTSSTYRLSLDWRLSGCSVPSGKICCDMYFYNSIASSLTTIGHWQLEIDAARPKTAWKSQSVNWKPNAKMFNLLVTWSCSSPRNGAYIDVDNIRLTLPQPPSCSISASPTRTSTDDCSETDTPTTTPTNTVTPTTGATATTTPSGTASTGTATATETDCTDSVTPTGT